MASPEGFEPPTYGLEVRCSIQLSYRDIKMERVEGIEPSQPAWKAGALPLSYTRPQRVLYLFSKSITRKNYFFCNAWNKAVQATNATSEFSMPTILYFSIVMLNNKVKILIRGRIIGLFFTMYLHKARIIIYISNNGYWLYKVRKLLVCREHLRVKILLPIKPKHKIRNRRRTSGKNISGNFCRC